MAAHHSAKIRERIAGFSDSSAQVVARTGMALLCIVLPLRAEILQGNLTIKLEPAASGLVSPIAATHAGDGSGRLFVVDQIGQVRIVEDGELLPTPFLDVTDKIVELSSIFDERGLLGLAFHPDYAMNGRFFVRYSAPREGDPAEPCNDPKGFIVGCHKAILAEYTVSMDPNVADPGSEMILLSVDEPQFNHNAGTVAFGPDGFLYVSLGDGGGANDGLADEPPSHGANGNGQNIETFLGSMLRIDVDGEFPYTIPVDNPFVGTEGLDEIYAFGFRNPYTFSFDDGSGGDGRLILADVGQDLFEEIDIVVNGGNYGWVLREGANCFDPFDPTNPPVSCPSEGMIDPIAEYTHAEGGTAIVGGFVYRGSGSPGLVGTYVFGDFTTDFDAPGSGRLYYLAEPGCGDAEVREFIIGPDNHPYGMFLKGFGEDEDGEVYVLGSTELPPTGTTGVVERLVVVGDCDGDRDVDLDDHVDFDNCLTGPGDELGENCGCMDFDGDNNVSLSDFQGFQLAFTQSPCGNGVLDSGEECDDGNVTPGDGCDANCLNENLAECTINFDVGCPDAAPQCGSSFSSGGTCATAFAFFCYASGARSYRVTPATSPLTITLDNDLDKLTVFFVGHNGGTGTMTFYDCNGDQVDAPIAALGNCAVSMPPSQTLVFSRSVRSVEVVASGPGQIWIDNFHVNPP